jgi:hypothetical protein
MAAAPPLGAPRVPVGTASAAARASAAKREEANVARQAGTRASWLRSGAGDAGPASRRVDPDAARNVPRLGALGTLAVLF